jgi:hypothetical protein
VVERAERILAARAPALPPDVRRRCARVSVQLVRALLPLVAAAAPAERAAMVEELKAVQRGYLAPLFGEAPPPGPPGRRRGRPPAGGRRAPARPPRAQSPTRPTAE